MGSSLRKEFWSVKSVEWYGRGMERSEGERDIFME